MKKQTIANAAIILLLGVIIMSVMIFSGKTDATPFAYRTNTTLDSFN